MFEAVVDRHFAQRAVRRSAYSLGATILETLIITGLVALTAHMAARPKPEPLVPVQFIRPAAVARPQPPPAAAPAARPAAARRVPPADASPTVAARPRGPLALVQPREITDEMKPPDPNEPIEDYGDAGEGVEGGVIGGIPGYVPGEAEGVAGAVVARATATIEEAPQYATTGYHPPREAQAGCVRGAIRLPESLLGSVTSSVVVKFAVTRGGTISAFEVMTPITDSRIGEVIRQAILSCRWVPGTDAQGRATAIWVVMPFRFELS